MRRSTYGVEAVFSAEIDNWPRAGGNEVEKNNALNREKRRS